METPCIKLPRLSVGRPKASDSAKKRAKEVRSKRNARSVIYIGPLKERWNKLKAEIGVKTNPELAKILMDRFEETQPSGPTHAWNISPAGRVAVTSLPEPALSLLCESDSGDDSDREDASETEETAHTPEIPPVAEVTSKRKSPEESPIAPQCRRERTMATQTNVEPTIVTRTRQKPTKTTAMRIAREATTDLQVMQQQTCLDPLSHIQSECGKLVRNSWNPAPYRIITATPSTQGVARQPSTTRQASLGPQVIYTKVRKQPGIIDGVSGPCVSVSGTTQDMPSAVDVRGQMSQANPASTACSVSNSSSSNTIMSVDSVKNMHDLGEVGNDIHECALRERSTDGVKQEQEQQEGASNETLTSGALQAESSTQTSPAIKNSQAGEDEILVLTEVKLEQEELEECRSKQLEGSTNCVEKSATVASLNEATVADMSTHTSTASAGKSVLHYSTRQTQVIKDKNKDIENKEATVADMSTHTAKGVGSAITGAKETQVSKDKSKDIENKETTIAEMFTFISTHAATVGGSSTSGPRDKQAHSEVKLEIADQEHSDHDAVLLSKTKHLSDRSSRNAKRRKAQREIDDYVRPKKFKVRESDDSENKRHSTRTRHKEVRPDYSDLNELGGISDLDLDSISESEDTDSEVENIDLLIGEDEFVASSDDTQSLAEENVGTSTAARRKQKNAVDDDPDFDPDFDSDDLLGDDKRKKAKIRNKKAKSSSEKKSDEDSTSNNDSDEDYTENFEKPKHVSARERNTLKKLNERKNRIKVTLADHPDKYFEEEFVSPAMMDRGKSKEEKTSHLMVCALCRKYKTENVTNLEIHLEQHMNDDFKCNACGIEFETNLEIILHNRQKHRCIRRDTEYICPECPEFYYSQQKMNSHMAGVHGKKGFVCRFCYMVLASQDDLPEHLIERHNGKVKVCPLCKGYFKFGGKYTLDTHMETCQQKKKKIPCQICGKEITRSALKSHVKTVHENERKFNCTMCSYTAADSLKLKYHIQAKHTDERLYQCDDCDFKCVQKYQLTSHRRTHTGETPFKCDQCPYAAAWNVQLKDHKKLHGLPSSVTCGECGVLLKNQKCLNLHNKKEHIDNT